MSTRVLPDAETIVIDYLLSSDAAALVGNRIYDRSPAKVLFPFLIVRRIAGRPQTHHWLDKAQIEVTAWIDHGRANASSIARNACETAIAALHDLPRENLTDAVVTACEDVTAPRPIPDSETSNVRYIGEVLLTIHPGAEGS